MKESRLRSRKILVATIFALATITVLSFISCNRVALRTARSISCGSQMKAVCLAARLWASDRHEFMPTNFMCMSNEVVTPLVLHCNEDAARPRVSTWEEFAEAKSSYEMISPGTKEGVSNVVFIRCKIHGHVGFADGSVMKSNRTEFVGKR